MAGTSTAALANGASEALTLPATWASYTASYVCSDPADATANAWLEGSADGGVTWFALTPGQRGSVPSGSLAGVRFYTGQPVNAVQAFVRCGEGNTVTVTVTGE